MNATRLLLLTILSVLLACHLVSAAGVVPAWVEGGLTMPNVFHRHSVIEDSKGDLWLFGGNSVNCTFTIGELWKMTVRSNYSWSQIKPIGNIPTIRSDFYFWVDKYDNLYVFGGRSACNDSLSDLWMFNTTSVRWILIGSSGRLDRGTIGIAGGHPGPRVGTAAWIVNDEELWLYGGGIAGLGTVYQDVWKFSLKSFKWTCMMDRGDRTLNVWDTDYPGQRTYRAIAAADKNGTVWIYDMTSPSYSLFARLKLAIMEWTVIGTYTDSVYGTLGQYSSATQPRSIFPGALVYIGNNVLALTTASSTFVLNQWYYDITFGQWALMFGPADSNTIPTLTHGQFQQVDPAGTPGLRAYYGTSVTRGNTWVVRGTMNGDRSNDTWVFPVNRCNSDISPCDSKAVCVDHLGWTDCTCGSGYEGDGRTCTSIVPPVAPVSPPVPVPVAAPVVPISPPITPPIAVPITAPVTEPVAVPVNPPVTAPVVVPIPSPVPEPIATPVAAPIATPTTQPVPEPMAAPIIQPVPEPIAAPITRPIAAPIAVPIVQPLSEPVASPIARVTPEGSPISAPLHSAKPAPYDGSQVVSSANQLLCVTIYLVGVIFVN